MTNREVKEDRTRTSPFRDQGLQARMVLPIFQPDPVLRSGKGEVDALARIAARSHLGGDVRDGPGGTGIPPLILRGVA